MLILLVGLFLTFAASAKENTDSAHLALYHRYYQLFSTDRAEEFYKTSEQLQSNFLKKGEMLSYYKIRQNEIFYDAEHGYSYKAIVKASNLLEDMKASDSKYYELPYMSLANIFELRGNYRISIHYYQEALKNINAKDSTGLAHLYSQLAAITTTRDIDEAKQWIDQMGHVISHDSLYYKVYLTTKGQILFFSGEKEAFFENLRELADYSKRSALLDHNGEHVLQAMEDAFNGKYNEALWLLNKESQDYDDIRRCDIRVRIYEMMGYYELAVKETARRRELRDSLNNDLLFNNINEINTAIDVAKLNEKAAREREFWLTAVIALLVVALMLIISRYFSHRRHQKQILSQKEQLEAALNEAKESERMKNNFIKHISHEVRTPLNIITGYAQVVSNPRFELEKKERTTLLQAIEQNTAAIIDIVNDLLEVSLDETRERYRRDDLIVVNDFCRQLMEKTEEDSNKGRLALSFLSSLSNDFVIQSNQNAIERILQQLLSNALKFTEKGQVELSVSKNADDSKMYFAVTDTGIGIPEERSEQVFEHFYKLDSFKQGLGIGLSMSRKIAILLGGTLDIDKDYHNGTRMILIIPIK